MPILCQILCLFSSLQSKMYQVALDSGHVVVSTEKYGVRSQKTYNDDNSHYVAFYHNGDGYATLCLILIYNKIVFVYGVVTISAFV